MSSLRVLRLSGNDLQFVPASIRCLRLDFIDLTGNEMLCGPFQPYKHLLTKAAPLLQIAVAYLQNKGFVVACFLILLLFLFVEKSDLILGKQYVRDLGDISI